MSKIKVIYKEPCGKPEYRTIENDLRSFQQLVQGYIEIVPWGYGKHGEARLLVVNEEGKLNGMDFNFEWGFDEIMGPAVWCCQDEEDLGNVDLDLMTELQYQFNDPEDFIKYLLG